MSGWQDSNLRPPAPKAGAMTATLHPEEVCKYSIINAKLSSYYFEITKNVEKKSIKDYGFFNIFTTIFCAKKNIFNKNNICLHTFSIKVF